MAKMKPIIDISVLIKAKYPSLKCLNFVGGEGENGSSEERVHHSVLENIPVFFQARKAQDGEMSEQEIKAIAS